MTTPPDAPRDLLERAEKCARMVRVLGERPITDEASEIIALLYQRVRAAEAERDRLREALLNLKRGACWCEVGIGNPMVRGVHSNACQRALDVVGASRPGEPQP